MTVSWKELEAPKELRGIRLQQYQDSKSRATCKMVVETLKGTKCALEKGGELCS